MAEPGDVPEGKDTVLSVGATAPPDIAVGAALSWSAPRRRNTNIRKYYAPTPSKTITGPSEDTWTIGCDLTSDDDGQRFIIARYADGATFFISFVDSEGNGRYQEVRASGEEPAGRNPDEPNSATYSFGGVADPVNIGTGPG